MSLFFLLYIFIFFYYFEYKLDFYRVFYFWQYLGYEHIKENTFTNIFISWFHPIFVNLLFGIVSAISDNYEIQNNFFLIFNLISLYISILFFYKILVFFYGKTKKSLIICIIFFLNPAYILYAFHSYDTIYYISFTIIFFYYFYKLYFIKFSQILLFKLSLCCIILFFIRHSYELIWVILIFFSLIKKYNYRKIIPIMVIPLLVISSMIIKNLFIYNQYNYGTPFEILNQNLSFLSSKNKIESSQIQKLIFKNETEKRIFLDKYPHLKDLKSFENNNNKETYLNIRNIKIIYPIQNEIIKEKEKCFIKDKYLINLQISDDIKWKEYLNKLGKLNFSDKEKIKLQNSLKSDTKKNIQNSLTCNINMNWYGNKLVNDLRKSEIKQIFIDYPLIPIFIFQQNFIDSLNSSIDYFMIFPNRMRSFEFTNLFEKLFYPNLNNIFDFQSSNYFLDKLSKISLSKLMLILFLIFLLFKNIKYILSKPNFLNVMSYTIFFSLLTIFFGSGEYERYFFMNEPIIFLFILTLMKFKDLNQKI